MKNKIVKDSLWNILDYFSTVAIALITAKFLIQEIHTDGYGFYMLFISLIGTFGLVDMGMGMAVSFIKKSIMNQTFALIFYGIVGSVFIQLLSFLLLLEQKFF